MTAVVTNNRVLAKYAAKIRTRCKRAAADVIDVGRLLAECREQHCKHGEWLPWLEREFGWSERTAQNFISVHEMSKSANFADLSLPVSSLYLLAAPSTPEEARTGVIERVKAGEKMPVEEIKRTIAESKPDAKLRGGARASSRRPTSQPAKQSIYAPLDSVAYVDAPAEKRTRFMCAIGYPAWWGDAPEVFREMSRDDLPAAPAPATGVLSRQECAELQRLVESVDRLMGRNADIIELLGVVNRLLLPAAPSPSLQKLPANDVDAAKDDIPASLKRPHKSENAAR